MTEANTSGNACLQVAVKWFIRAIKEHTACQSACKFTIKPVHWSSPEQLSKVAVKNTANAFANITWRSVGCKKIPTVYSAIYCWKPNVIM